MSKAFRQAAVLCGFVLSAGAAKAAVIPYTFDVAVGSGDLLQFQNSQIWNLPELAFAPTTLSDGDTLQLLIHFPGGRATIERVNGATSLTFFTLNTFVPNFGAVPATPGEVAASYNFLGFNVTPIDAELVFNPISFPASYGPLSSIGDFNISYAAESYQAGFSFTGLRLDLTFNGDHEWLVSTANIGIGSGADSQFEFRQAPEPSSLSLALLGMFLFMTPIRRRR